MLFLSDVPLYCWLYASVLGLIGLSSLLVQLITMVRYNLSALYYGCAATLLLCGLTFAIHEMSKALRNAAEQNDMMAQHLSIADGASISFSIIAFYGLSALFIALFGGVLSYFREWIFREELSS